MVVANVAPEVSQPVAQEVRLDLDQQQTPLSQTKSTIPEVQQALMVSTGLKPAEQEFTLDLNPTRLALPSTQGSSVSSTDRPPKLRTGSKPPRTEYKQEETLPSYVDTEEEGDGNIED